MTGDATAIWGSVSQLAHHDSDNGQHHDHFNGHGEDADKRAQRAVQQIGDDELVHS
jgi:hypothetical protein